MGENRLAGRRKSQPGPSTKGIKEVKRNSTTNNDGLGQKTSSVKKSTRGRKGDEVGLSNQTGTNIRASGSTTVEKGKS